MITIEKISIEELPELIRLSYLGDSELLHNYHVEKFFFVDSAAASTYDAIKLYADHFDMFHYKIIYNGKSIGYFSGFKEFLFSFAIALEYRTRAVLSDWWKKVVEVMGRDFACGLYLNNTRAINFLKMQGMKVEDITENNEVVLITN